MKKILLFCALLSTAFSLKAQVIFSEDFDGIGGPTAGGAGTYVFPAGWSLRNVDNRTPASNVSYVNEAWERREDFNGNVADSCMFSTSWYSPAGAANDFAWTPLIGPLPANCELDWNAKAYDPAYSDGYEVRIMTVPPTGGTGVIGNQLTNSTVLFSVTGEASSWTAHSLLLNAYAGQSVYIGFRNNSNDKFLLCIDDIVVHVQINTDPQLLSYTAPSQYSRIPLQQQPSIPLSATIRNNGQLSVNNVSLTANVYDMSNNALVYTASSSSSSLVSGASSVYNTSPFVPSAVGNYRIDYVANGASDDVPGNNILQDSIRITDSTYARDRGPLSSGLGIGTGNGGYLGQHFVSTQTAQLSSVDIYLATPVSGMHMGAAIFPMTNGYPDPTPIYVWPNILISSSTPGWFHFQHTGNPLILMPDTFVVEAVEVDSTLSVGLTMQIFTTNTTWVDWPTNPISPWGNNEDYGSNFAKAYMVRANLLAPCAGFVAQPSVTPATCGACTDGVASVAVTGGTPGYTYVWSPPVGNGAADSSLAPGTYLITIADQSGCSITATAVITNSCSSYDPYVSSSTMASCGICNDGTATVSTTNGTGPFTISWSNGDTTATADSLTPGNYTVTVTDFYGCSDTANVSITFSTGLNSGPADAAIGVYPNPSEGDFMLDINFSSKSDLDVEIYNAVGQLITSEHHAAYTTGKLPFHLDAPGMYTVKVRTADGSRVIPVLVK